MSPASYLTAPPRDAAYIVALSRFGSKVPRMVFYLALLVLIVAVAGGIAFAVVRGVQLYRDVKRARGAMGAEFDRISANTAKIEHHAARAEAASGRLQSATDRLAVSRARLDVQLAAVREARAQVRRVFWFVPGL